MHSVVPCYVTCRIVFVLFVRCGLLPYPAIADASILSVAETTCYANLQGLPHDPAGSRWWCYRSHRCGRRRCPRFSRASSPGPARQCPPSHHGPARLQGIRPGVSRSAKTRASCCKGRIRGHEQLDRRGFRVRQLREERHRAPPSPTRALGIRADLLQVVKPRGWGQPGKVPPQYSSLNR